MMTWRAPGHHEGLPDIGVIPDHVITIIGLATLSVPVVIGRGFGLTIIAP